MKMKTKNKAGEFVRISKIRSMAQGTWKKFDNKEKDVRDLDEISE
jgi:hypothetical protein